MKDSKIEKTSGHEIVFKGSLDGQENIKISVRSSGLGRQVKTPSIESKTFMELLLSTAVNNKNSNTDFLKWA